MVEQGNPFQWDSRYPTAKTVEEDMLKGTSYVCVDQMTDDVLGTFNLVDYEPQFASLHDGKWHSDHPYVAVHRLGTLPLRGAEQFIFDYLLKNYSNIRMDTHPDNKPMIAILEQLGFKYCGQMTFEGRFDRVAYDHVSI